jgi:hypothetical protein
MLRRFCHLWSLLWGIILWCIWIEWNNLNFNGIKRYKIKIEIVIWEGFLDYNRFEWECTTYLIKIFLKMNINSLICLTWFGIHIMPFTHGIVGRSNGVINYWGVGISCGCLWLCLVEVVCSWVSPCINVYLQWILSIYSKIE